MSLYSVRKKYVTMLTCCLVSVRPTPELVDVVKKVYQERNLDAKFLIPVISGFNKVCLTIFPIEQ
jgi:hypothetical protein